MPQVNSWSESEKSFSEDDNTVTKYHYSSDNRTITDTSGDTTVTDSSGDTTVTDTSGETTVTDTSGETTVTDTSGETTVTDVSDDNTVTESGYTADSSTITDTSDERTVTDYDSPSGDTTVTETDFTSDDDHNPVPRKKQKLAPIKKITFTLIKNTRNMTYGKTLGNGDFSGGPSRPPPSAPTMPRATVPGPATAKPLNSENDPPAKKRRPATHLNFPPGEEVSTSNYSSRIDPTLMLPPGQLVPELRKLREEIELRNHIIDNQYEKFQEQLQTKTVIHKSQVTELENAKTTLVDEKNSLQEQLAAMEKVCLSKELRLTIEREVAKQKLTAEEGKVLALRNQLNKMTEEKKALEEKLLRSKNGWAEDQKKWAKAQSHAREQVNTWICEKLTLVARIYALEQEKAAMATTAATEQ